MDVTGEVPYTTPGRLFNGAIGLGPPLNNDEPAMKARVTVLDFFPVRYGLAVSGW